MKIDSKTRILFILFFLFGIFSGKENSQAAIIQTNDCSQNAIQSAINFASNSDTVSVAGGNCTWSSSVVVPDSKGIILNGNGAVISGQVNLRQNSTISSRITGFNFIAGNAVYVSGSKTSVPFRIDHNNFTVTIGGSILLEIGGNAPGLIDHNSFNAPRNSEMIHNYGRGANNDSGWIDDIIPGSADAVYIEDNTFTNNDPDLATANPAYFWGNSAVQSYYGARTVFRYNNLSMSQVDQHGTPGMIGARWWEIYENTFYVVQNGNQSQYMQIRAGSGIIFNNHKTGYPCLWSCGNIELVEEDTGYPALYQIGRGKNQTLDPAYVWGNDTAMPVVSGSSNVQVNRDYYLSEKPGYTPYTYPHPLITDCGYNPITCNQISVDTTPPSVPTGVSVN